MRCSLSVAISTTLASNLPHKRPTVFLPASREKTIIYFTLPSLVISLFASSLSRPPWLLVNATRVGEVTSGVHGKNRLGGLSVHTTRHMLLEELST